MFVCFVTSKGTTENSSKERATLVFSVIFVLLMESVIGVRVICLVKVKYLSESGCLKHGKEIQMFLVWELYLELAWVLVPIPHHT